MYKIIIQVKRHNATKWQNKKTLKIEKGISIHSIYLDNYLRNYLYYLLKHELYFTDEIRIYKIDDKKHIYINTMLLVIGANHLLKSVDNELYNIMIERYKKYE